MKDKIQITELFMAQASKEDRFYGTITRTTDSQGNPVCRGKIKVGDGYVFAEGCDQDELGERLDELVKLAVKKNIHCDEGNTTKISETTLFLN